MKKLVPLITLLTLVFSFGNLYGAIYAKNVQTVYVNLVAGGWPQHFYYSIVWKTNGWLVLYPANYYFDEILNGETPQSKGKTVFLSPRQTEEMNSMVTRFIHINDNVIAACDSAEAQIITDQIDYQYIPGMDEYEIFDAFLRRLVEYSPIKYKEAVYDAFAEDFVYPQPED